MNKLARNTLALGTVTMIVTAALQFSANGADPIVAQSNSSAITASGITGLVNTQECRAESTGPATVGTAPVCGTGLATQTVGVTTQNASTGLDGDKGTSTAAAEVAGVDLTALPDIDLSTIPANVLAIDTGTVLDDVVTGLGPVLGPVLEQALAPLLTAIQTAAVAPITTALQAAIPVSVDIGAVSSVCSLTAGATPTLTSSVAGINILVDLPGTAGDLNIPVQLNVSPNSALIGAVAPQQLVDGIVDGLEATLTQSLNNALGPVAGLINDIQTEVIDPILAQVGPALLAPVGNALTPILSGTVNKQETLPSGAAQVTALDLNVLGNTATLDVARSSCGPNTVRTVVTTTPPPTTPTPTKTTPTKDKPSDEPTNEPADPIVDNVDDSDTVADADAQADADVTTTLPSTGAPNLLPFWLLGIALLMFGGAVLLNEKRRLNQI